MLDFTEDLQFVADRVSTSLNIFNKTKVTANQLIIAYTDRDFIAVTMVEHPEHPQYATLQLRTKDMAASWKNVLLVFLKSMSLVAFLQIRKELLIAV